MPRRDCNQDAHEMKSEKGLNTLGKIALGSAIVSATAFALTKFASAWQKGEAKKRKFADWLPHAIDDSTQGFKQAFEAFSSSNTGSDHISENARAKRANAACSQEFTYTDDGIMSVGFAYGANAERQQWANGEKNLIAQ